MFVKNNKFYTRSIEIKYLSLLFIFLLGITACQSNNTPQKSKLTPPPPDSDYFQEIGKEIGLDFVHSIGDKELSNIVESSGAGAAFLDYDQDGFIDLYVCSGTWVKGLTSGDKPAVVPENHLYHNL